VQPPAPGDQRDRERVRGAHQDGAENDVAEQRKVERRHPFLNPEKGLNVPARTDKSVRAVSV
jgi:hypothetical protein